MKLAAPFWGFLAERIDYRIAVSEKAAESVQPHLPGDCDIVPNGVVIPPGADPDQRENRIVFIGRHDPRKGLPVLLRAWPEIHRRTGARLRVIGSDPLQVRLALARRRLPDDGIDALGSVSQEERTRELLAAKALAAPSLGGESFGMILAEAFACATPVVASDISGYRDVMTPETGVLVPPGNAQALADALVGLVQDEPRRRACGAAARRLAQERYSWEDVGRRLASIYELVAGRTAASLAAAR
jgi:phosphatidylinositol alpha-mannosyltransferase